MSSPDKFWEGLANAIGREDLLAAYPDRMARVNGYENLARELAATFATRDRHAWLPLLEAHDVPFAPERRLEDLADDPQVKHLDMFYSLEHPSRGTVKAAHRPIRYDGDQRSDYAPPPALGEHTDEVLREAGIPVEQIAELRKQGIAGVAVR